MQRGLTPPLLAEGGDSGRMGAVFLGSGLPSVLLGHQLVRAVHLAQLWLLDFARGVPGNLMEDDFLGALVPGQLLAELVYLHLGAVHSLLDLDDGRGLLAQPPVGQADDGHVFFFF